jgi:DNA adenine methylase
MDVKPFLKWVGGKTQILDTVLDLFPATMKSYHEPFLGGGSVLLGFLNKVRDGSIELTGQVYASDLNVHLISLYKNVQERPTELIAAVKVVTDEFALCTGSVVNRKPTTIEEARTSAESYYYWIRQRFNAIPAVEREGVAASAMFLFLNKTCFRGVYREGPRGFNVPFGHYKNPTIVTEQHIHDVSDLIQGVVFTHQSFQDSFGSASTGDFVYLDPPYAPEQATSFVGYTADGFTLENHKHLFTVAKGMKERKVNILMSNADVPLVKEAFVSPAYTTRIISCRRAINSKEPASRTNEVLIRG